MEVMKINVVRAATTLAHSDLENDIMNEMDSCVMKSDVVEWINDVLFDEEGNYKENYQDNFNSYYDYYFKIISNCIV